MKLGFLADECPPGGIVKLTEYGRAEFEQLESQQAEFEKSVPKEHNSTAKSDVRTELILQEKDEKDDGLSATDTCECGPDASDAEPRARWCDIGTG